MKNVSGITGYAAFELDLERGWDLVGVNGDEAQLWGVEESWGWSWGRCMHLSGRKVVRKIPWVHPQRVPFRCGMGPGTYNSKQFFRGPWCRGCSDEIWGLLARLEEVELGSIRLR